MAGYQSGSRRLRGSNVEEGLELHYWFPEIIFSRPIAIQVDAHDTKIQEWLQRDAEKYPEVIYFFTLNGSTDIFQEET